MQQSHDPEIIDEFVSESLQGLQSVEKDLLSLEADGGSDVELVNRIFRAVHSIKGAGSFLDLTNLVKVSHHAETLLDDVRGGRRSADADVTDAVLGAIDTLVAMLESDDQGADHDCDEILGRLERVLCAGPHTADPGITSPSRAGPSESTVASPHASGSSHKTTASASESLSHATPVQACDSERPAGVDRDPELLSEFLEESLQGLDLIEHDLMELESAADSDHELVNRIFRTIHSIKGAGSFLELDNLVSTAHLAETILEKVRSEQMKATSQVADSILSAVDALKEMLRSEDCGETFDPTGTIAKMEKVLQGDLSAASAGSVAQDVIDLLGQATGVVYPVYRLEIDLAALHAAIDLKEGVLEGLKSVGTLRHASIALETIDVTTEGECTLYFETVLDPELLSMHFGISESRITLVDLTPSAGPTNASRSIDSVEKNGGSGQNEHSQADGGQPQATPVTQRPDTQPAAASVQNRPSESPAPRGNMTAATSNAEPSTSLPAKSNRSEAEQSMRVPARILHELLEWTGNMVMARNQLLNEYDFRDSNAFRTLSQAITGVHETVIETRMQTTGSLFERYRRVVRDLSRKLKKEVAFHIEGGDLELDRTILESFADPLTHLVRNCIDHALETPEERVAAGKNRQGNVYLRSYIQSGEIILAVQDDGRGISADRICSKAIDKGILTEDCATELNDDEKVMLIFEAGFSTKEQATDVSGRGVGMDVVRNNIEKVGGTIALKTSVGEGSTFSAHLPLAKALVSSSLTTALVIEIGGEDFAIPETAISEIIQYDERALEAVRMVDGRCVYQHRDQLVAIIDLRDPLGMQADSPSKKGKPPIDMRDKEFAPRANSKLACLVIIQFRDQFFGTVVDEVIGMQEIIVRSNPKLIQECTVYSGHTVLGNGRIALILDINGIVNKMRLKFPSKTEKASDHGMHRVDYKKGPASQKMLIFQNEGSEYFAIPIELVAFIEQVQQSELRTVGKKEFCQLKAETLSILRLEDFLPVSPLDQNQNDMCLIRPAAVEHPIGVLVGQDMSVVDVAETFETRLDDDNGIIGTFYHNDHLVMLLDLFCILEKHSPEKVRLTDDRTDEARILVAEDSLFFRKLIAQYITREEWEVEIVNDGQEAYDRLMNEPGRFNLIISDINMPRMDGFELVKKIREDSRFNKIPVVALTTMSDEHFREKGLRLGFDRYVIKIDKREVRATVAECLRIKRPG